MSAIDDENVTDATVHPEDLEAADPALRPKMLADFIGQTEVTDNLRVYIEMARKRGQSLDHVLLFGPPGLGKTTLAQIIANELYYEFRPTAAPAIAKPGDMAALLLGLEPWSVLFIDEIHRLNKVAAEMLYTAMEDFHIDLLVGEGVDTKSMRMDVPPFTLIGATTRPGMLPGPLRDRFGIQCRMEFYSNEELSSILERTSDLMAIAGEIDAFREIARCSRGTPRIAKRLLRRIRDHAEYEGSEAISLEAAVNGLARLRIDENGLNEQDRRYLGQILKAFGCGPVGLETLAASLSEDPDILEVQVEPYLMELGLIQRTPRGRVLTDNGCLLATQGAAAQGGTTPGRAGSLPGAAQAGSPAKRVSAVSSGLSRQPELRLFDSP